jgi:hypothetical protein
MFVEFIEEVVGNDQFVSKRLTGSPLVETLKYFAHFKRDNAIMVFAMRLISFLACLPYKTRCQILATA